jgi:hypothetical protein
MLARAYVRRKRFEARLIAEEVAAIFRSSDEANPSAPSPATPRPSQAPVAPSALLRSMGITL